MMLLLGSKIGPILGIAHSIVMILALNFNLISPFLIQDGIEKNGPNLSLERFHQKPSIKSCGLEHALIEFTLSIIILYFMLFKN